MDGMPEGEARRRSTVLTVTLNAAKDSIYVVDGYRLGAQHRSRREVEVPGGKGNNVAKVVRALGGEVIATGFLAGTVGEFVERGLAERGIETSFARAAGESRTCFSVLDERTHQLTEIYPPRGARIEPAHLGAFGRRFRLLAAAVGWIVCAGSIPLGVPTGFYADLVRWGREAGANVVVDSGPAELAIALEAGPWLAKCNAAEASALVGREIVDLDSALAAADTMRVRGAERVCITRGPDPAVLVCAQGAWIGSPPRITPLSAVGSGDALTGGLVLGLARGDEPGEALRLGLAAAAANALTLGAGELDPEVVPGLARRAGIVQRDQPDDSAERVV